MKHSQDALVILHLLEGKSLTSLEAMNKYGIMALHSRCSDIRKLISPYHLNSPMITVKTRNGETRVCNYSFNKSDIPKIKKLDSVKQLLTNKKAA